MLDPIDLPLFESPLCQNADDTVGYCTELLEKKGFVQEATCLRSLLGITSPGRAQLALSTLASMQVHDPEATEALHMARGVLRRAAG